MVMDGEMEEDLAPGFAAAPTSTLEASRGERKRSQKGDATLKKSAELAWEGDDELAEPEEPSPDNAAASDGGGEARTWFPESFLWQPLVETDGSGRAEVMVRVPDQLTTWRVLALAHTRDGQQAGAVHTFDSTLPLYVDPVVPAWLHAGDTLALPIQAVGLSGQEALATLRVQTGGPLEGAGVTEVLVPGDGSRFETVGVRALGAGEGQVRVELTSALGDDTAVRTIPVIPRGRPVSVDRGGTLASERELRLVGPAGADPTTQQLQVRVFPGPLAVLQAEVERALSGDASAGYGFLLATHLVDLAGRTGAEVDESAVRRLQILGWQRVVQTARAPDPGQASDLLAVLAQVDGHALAEQLRPRLVHTVEVGQRGDGTFARSDRAKLGAVLTQTAWAARALPPSASSARARASGALERYAADIDDGYTAAVVLASGLLSDSQAEPLIALVEAAMGTGPDGATTVSVPSGATNPWGYRPGRSEMLAWTWLAMHERVGPDVAGDLIAALMQGYDARGGFGAGMADAVALEAVLGGLPVVSVLVDVVLELDGEEVARATVDPAQPRVPALLEGRPGGGDVRISLRTEPAVPGLAYVAHLASWVPWSGDERLAGVDVEATFGALTVGRSGTVGLTIAAPSRSTVELEVGLPAGAAVESGALANLVSSGVLQSFDVGSDRVTLVTKAFGAGEILEITLQVTPAFAGRFGTRPLVVRIDGREQLLPPVDWEVSPEG